MLINSIGMFLISTSFLKCSIFFKNIVKSDDNDVNGKSLELANSFTGG